MQTSYPFLMAIGLPGMIANSADRTIDSYAASAEIPFGVAVAQDSTDTTAKLPAALSDTILGVALTKPSTEQQLLTGVVDYKTADTMNVMKRGAVYVTVEEAVSPTDPVYVRVAAEGSNTQLGAFRKSPDTVSTVDTAKQLTNAKWKTSASSGGLAVLELNLN